MLLAKDGLDQPQKLQYILSNMYNAFAAGPGGQVAIAIRHDLLMNMSAREAAGELAHELSHVRNWKVFVMA